MCNTCKLAQLVRGLTKATRTYKIPYMVVDPRSNTKIFDLVNTITYITGDSCYHDYHA